MARRYGTYYRHRKAYRALRQRRAWARKFPRSKWGIQYVPAGTEEGIKTYGKTFREADPNQKLARLTNHYYGKGDYGKPKSLERRIVEGAGSSLGSAAGSLVGMTTGIPMLGQVGGVVGGIGGHAIGRKISNWMGMTRAYNHNI